MKTIKCQHCETEFSAETKEAVLTTLYNHYLKEHHAVITGVDAAGKKAWMETFEADWKNAPETK